VGGPLAGSSSLGRTRSPRAVHCRPPRRRLPRSVPDSVPVSMHVCVCVFLSVSSQSLGNLVAMLVAADLRDVRVPAWHAIKYVARLRAETSRRVRGCTPAHAFLFLYLACASVSFLVCCMRVRGA
jgi:hypothetical protein